MLEISAFGDSITDGVALRGNPEVVLMNWPEMIEKELGVVIHNFGIGGHDTQQGLARIDDLWKFDSKITLIEFGMNDHVIISENGNSQVPIEQFRKNIVNICEQCKYHGSIPVLFTPNKVIEEYYFQRHPKEWYERTGGPNILLKNYREVILDIAKQYNYYLIDIYKAFEDQEKNIENLLRSPTNGNFLDGVHPYGQGIELYYKCTLKALKNIIGEEKYE